MDFNKWYKSRVNQPQPVEKTQPKVSFPKLSLPQQQGAKILSTPAEWRTAAHVIKENWPSTTEGPAAGMAPRGTPHAWVNGDIDPKRMDSIGAHEEMHKLFNHVANEYGKHATKGLINHLLDHTDKATRNHISDWLGSIGYDPKADNHNEEVFNYFHTYLTDPVNRERMRSKLKSAWRTELFDKKIKQGWRAMLDAAANVSEKDVTLNIPLQRLKAKGLIKAISSNDWQNITDSHDFNHAKVVDHTPHLVNSQAPKVFGKLLSHPEQFHSMARHYGGISAKTVHDVSPLHDQNDPATLTPSGILMLKPYHKKVEKGTQLYGTLPIAGWATMTTKNLFNAAGIGHLAEDVSTAEHEGIPLTVHNFGPEGSHTISEHVRREPKSDIDAYEPHQIAIMDYLANNNDRHGKNLMVSKPDEAGVRHLYGLDHERNFQYQFTPKLFRYGTGTLLDAMEGQLPKDYENSDTPGNYLRSKSLGPALKHSDIKGDEQTRLHKWWMENSGKIRDEMDRNLTAIQDPKLRQHVSNNFAKRWNVLNNWAKEGGKEDLFDREYQHKVFNDLEPEQHTQAVDDIMAKLPPGKPYLSANSLADYALKNHNHAPVVDETVSRLMGQMEPDDFAQFFLNNYNHPTLDVKKHALKHMFGGPTKQNLKIKAIIDKLAKMPDSVKKLFPFLSSQPETETAKLQETA